MGTAVSPPLLLNASARRRRAVLALCASAGVGAVTVALAHVALLAVFAPSAESEVAAAVTEALRPLTNELLRFQILLGATLAGAGAVIGAVLRALRLYSGLLPYPGRLAGVGLDAFGTLLVLALLVLRARGDQPALFEGTLPFLPVVPPLAVDVGLSSLAGLALLAGAWRRRELPWLLGATAVLTTTALLLPQRTPAKPSKPHVVLLVGEALRPDRFSRGGHPRQTTPELDRFAREGASFEDCLTPIARTVPSWTSILTGLYPHHHGVRHDFPTRARRLPALPSLARAFRSAGYRTVAVSDYAGDFFVTFDWGYDEVIGPTPFDLRTIYQREVYLVAPVALALLNNPLGRALFPRMGVMPENARADRLADRAEAVLRDAEAPVFLTVFFSTTHAPWAASHPFAGRFGAPDYDGPHRWSYRILELSDPSRAEARVGRDAEERLRDLYDATLAEVDAAMGRVIGVVDAHPELAETIVTVTADHGASLYEDGTSVVHGNDLRNDLANRVPWFVRAPGVRAGQTVPETVSLVDLAPTVAGLAGVPFLAGDGESHVALLRGKTRTRPRGEAFAETGLWLRGRLDERSMSYPPIERLARATVEDDFLLSVHPRFEDRVVEAKHRLLRRGRARLVYRPTPKGVTWSDPRSVLRDRLLEWIGQDPLRRRDERDHFVGIPQ